MTSRNVLAAVGVVAIAAGLYWLTDRILFRYWNVVDAAERIITEAEGE